MDSSNSRLLDKLFQALSTLRDPSWDVSVQAKYRASPDHLVGVDVQLALVEPRVDEEHSLPPDSDTELFGLMTIKEVARFLGVSPRTVQTIVAEGGITPVKVRSQTRFDRRDLDAFVRQAARGRGGRQ